MSDTTNPSGTAPWCPLCNGHHSWDIDCEEGRDDDE